HTGGGQTPNSHTRTRLVVPSATRRRFLGFASAMSLDLTTLRRRLQKALGKKFTVGDVLGEGGFAAVFRVRDQDLGQDVAVKVLDLGLTPSPGLAERFVREARTSARLEHPHIVPIYKVGGYKNEVLYIVMRCLDGPSLRQLLEKHQRLSLRDAARLARQVADALGHAHLHGVVHRDVKPDNILLDSSGHVLVTDFGIAKAAVGDRALAKDPAERFQTAEELSRALVEALPTAAQDSVRMRSPVLSGALNALVGLGVVGGLLVFALTVLSKAPRLSVRAPIPD